jgi:hypothetical protein
VWDRAAHEALLKNVPLKIEIDWEKRPSAEKYGCVNALLSVLEAFSISSGSFYNTKGIKISTLQIYPIKRKLTDKKKRNFAIVGHDTRHPLCLSKVHDLLFEIYANYHFLVETSTTYRQYYPSASVIVRCRNFLQYTIVPSPGSWGSDIIGMSFDWEGTFILETSLVSIPTQRRKNFRGFKLVPSAFKYVLFSREQSKSEMAFLSNNGFNDVGVFDSSAGWSSWIQDKVNYFLSSQEDRILS